MGVDMQLMVKHYLPVSSIAAQASVLCNQAMIKNSKRRDQKWLADKLVHAMGQQPKITAAKIAEKCKVSRQAVNGWRQNGRIDKTNLSKLAELFRTPLRYWLDHDAPYEIVSNGNVTKDLGNTGAATIVSTIAEEAVMDLLRSAGELVRAWLVLPERDRNRFKKQIEVLALEFREPAPDQPQEEEGRRKTVAPK